MHPLNIGPPVRGGLPRTRPKSNRHRYRNAAAVAVGTLALATGGVTFAGGAQAAGSMYVAPYVDMSNSQEGVLNTVISSDGLSAFSAAFVIGVGCNQEWGDTLPVGGDPTIGAEISQAQSAGAQVIVSSGGSAGEPLSFTCSDQGTIDADYQAIISDYGTDSLDFDIEGAAIADTAGIDRTIQAMKDLQASNPGLVWSVTVPVLPSGLTNYGVALVQDARNMGVTIPMINLMTMDYYQGDIEMGQAAINAAQSTLGQIQAIDSSYSYGNVGITPMIGVNDDGSTFTLADATTVADWAAQNGIGRLAFWSVDRDQSCSAVRGAASPTCSGVAQSTGQFTQNFLSGGSSGGGGGGGGGGGCFAAWSASTSYVPGDQVSYNAVNYTSIWYSSGVVPGSAIAWDVWQSDGSC